MIACPHCGGEINEDAKFCRHCGSSDSDGWRAAHLDDDEIDTEQWGEDDDFDYDQYVQDHHSDSVTATGTPLIWRWAAIVLLLLFLAATFGLLF